jgi:hypothetical protein
VEERIRTPSKNIFIAHIAIEQAHSLKPFPNTFGPVLRTAERFI